MSVDDFLHLQETLAHDYWRVKKYTQRFSGRDTRCINCDTQFLVIEDEDVVISESARLQAITCEFECSVSPFSFLDAVIKAVKVDGTEIGKGAFSGCKNLKLVCLSDQLFAIETLAFWQCVALKEIYIPSSISRIGCSAFEGCGLTKIDLSDCSLLHKIQPETFKRCRNLREVLLPESLTEIGDEAFESCRNLETVDIPSNVRRIGTRTFADCGLFEIQIGKSLFEIGDEAFLDCWRLASIHVVGTGVVNDITLLTVSVIGHSAFDGSQLLTE
jgi:hypothetical protein